MSSTPLRRVSSRALRAASRAAAASITFWMMPLASFGCVSNQCAIGVGDGGLHHRLHLGADQLVLGLRGEFRVRHLDRQHGGHAFAHVLADERETVLLAHALGVFRHHAGQRLAEAGEMRAAVALRDVVGEAQHRLVEAVVPGQREFDADAVPRRPRRCTLIGGANTGALRAVEPFDEGDQAALVART